MHRSRIRHLRPSGRLLISLLMTAIMVAGITGGMTTTVAAQNTETLLDQATVAWDDSWQAVDIDTTLGDSLAIELPEFDPQNRLDLTNDNSHVVLGSLGAVTDMTTVTNAVLTTFAQDPANALEVAGGMSTEPNAEYRAYLFNLDGQEVGVYIRLNDGARLEIFLAPVTIFADEMNTAQTMITVDGVGVLDGVDGAAIATSLAARTGEALPITSQTAGVGGEYLIPNYNLQVVWPAGWSVVSQDDAGIVLLNAAETIELTIVGDPMNGRTIDDWAADGEWSFYHDQGANATISGPVVTDSGWMLATDGDFGPRLAQGSASSNPAFGVLVFAAHIPAGSDLIAVATETHGVTVDGNPVLQGIEAVIPPAA